MKKLKDDLKNNLNLMAKFNAEKKKAMDSGAATDNEIIINAAKALGYSITATELEKELAEMQDLSEDELAAVVGGFDIYENGEYGDDASNSLLKRYTSIIDSQAASSTNGCWSNFLCQLAFYD